MKYIRKEQWLLALIFVFSAAGYAIADRIERGGLDVKGNLTVRGTSTLTGAIASPTLTTPTIDISIWDDQGSTPANPSSGFYKTYFKSDGKFYKLDSSGTEEEVGSGGAGGTNDMREYVDNGKFETDVTTGWTTYDDAAAAPVDGTGGTVTTGWTRTTTNGEVLRDTASAELAKDAANRQGEGVCVDVTLDPSDYTTLKGVPVSFEYNTTSAYASGDVLVYGIDVSGATVQAVQTIQSSTAGTVLASSGFTRWNGIYYPTAVANSSYKFCLHIATTNASAWDMHVDSFHVGNQNATPGAIVADLGTETWVDSWANSTTSVRLTRVGTRIFVEGTSTVTGVGATNFDITIPTAYTPIDSVGSGDKNFGYATLTDTGTAFFTGVLFRSATNTISVYANLDSGTYGGINGLTSAIPHTWANTDLIKFTASWDVSGWSSSAALSTTETLLSTVKAKYRKSAAQTITASTATILDASTKDYDTHNAVTTGASWKFTAPKTGVYHVDASLQWVTRTYADGNLALLRLYKNGAQVDQYNVWESSGTPAVVVSNVLNDDIYLLKGDYIDVRAFNQGSVSTNTDGMIIAIHELPDFSIFSVYGISEIAPATGYSSGGLVNYGITAGQYGDLDSETLNPGEWDCDLTSNWYSNGATTTTSILIGLTTTSGNSSSGMVFGDNAIFGNKTTSTTTGDPLTMSIKGILVTTPTIYYFKAQATASITNLQIAWSWRCRKVK